MRVLAWGFARMLSARFLPACLLLGGLLGCSSSSSPGFQPEPDAQAAADATMSGADAGSDAAAPEGGLDASAADGAPDGPPTGDSQPDAPVEAGPPPVVLASDVPNAWLLAVEGGSLYWLDFVAGDGGAPVGRVMTMPVAGGPEVILAATPGVMPQRLVVDGADVVWLDDRGAVWRVARGGGRARLVPSGALDALAASGASAFCRVGAGISRVALDGGGVTALTSTGSPLDLAVAAGQVFWATASGTLERISATDGGTPSHLVRPQADASADEYVSPTAYQNLATDGVRLYWNRVPSATVTGAVLSVPVKGGAPTVLASTGGDTPLSVATDGKDVYYLDLGPTTTLRRVAIDGGAPALVDTAGLESADISGSPGPTIALDARNVYVLDPPRILKIAR